MAQGAWQPPALCRHTGLQGCSCLWCDPSPPCSTVPRRGGPCRLRGVSAPQPVPSSTHQGHASSSDGGGPQPSTWPPLMLQEGLHPQHLHPALSSSWDSFCYRSNHFHSSCSQKLPVCALAGVCRGSGFHLFIVEEKRWLQALLLTAVLAVSWQTQGFPAKGVHQAERGAQDLHGTCRGVLRPGLLVPPCQKLRLLLSEGNT